MEGRTCEGMDMKTFTPSSFHTGTRPCRCDLRLGSGTRVIGSPRTVFCLEGPCQTGDVYLPQSQEKYDRIRCAKGLRCEAGPSFRRTGVDASGLNTVSTRHSVRKLL